MVQLNPKTISKYVDQLVVPPVYVPDPITGDYTINVSQFSQQILPSSLPPTNVWGYGGTVKDPVTGLPVAFKNAPGATFEAKRGIPINVQWVNDLNVTHPLPVDPTLHWADPNNFGMPTAPFTAFPPGYPLAQSPVPIVPHLHSGENPSAFDGHPDAWFTAGEAIKGPAFVSSKYSYPNKQQPTTLWYHDHVLGITRLNVLMGMAGFYLLRDPDNNPLDKSSSPLPKGIYEIPIVIQDRSFNTDGTFAFPTVGINPTIHPYWMPEFFGNAIMVNGKTWPNLNVERRQYRFRLLNGSNARFYNLSFSNKIPFVQIGSDGGYLKAPVTLTTLLIAPGERADILVDFSAIAVGTKLILQNDAKAPFTKGAAADPQTVGQIMQFSVINSTIVPPNQLPLTLNTIPVLTPNATTRTLTLFEVKGPAGPLEVLLDGQIWDNPISELPRVGSTEEWQVVNLTADAHPIHLHLVQFQLAKRQEVQSIKYTTDWTAINGIPPLNQPTIPLPVIPYLQGKPMAPALNEMGWKDTVVMYPGQVTNIRVRFAPQDANPAPGNNLFPFDPTLGAGYVWHCHIIDHEDNEMMRPYKVIN